jgi:hypothetical protein
MTMELAHVVEVVSNGGDYRAECSCGWASDWWAGDDVAEAAGVDHLEVVWPPGAGFERFMDGLLNLQDDIARAVVWLAENWSVELPVPRWYGTGDGERPGEVIRVLSYCHGQGELERAAELLDAPIVDDPKPDRWGCRYRRASRAFGRVVLEAYDTRPVDCAGCGTSFGGGTCPACGRRADGTRSAPDERAATEAVVP